MSTPVITWRCGCRAEARDVGEGIETHPVDWELVHCPLHGAAGELRQACKAAATLLALSQLPHCDKRMASNETLIQGALDALNIALALAEPKSNANNDCRNCGGTLETCGCDDQTRAFAALAKAKPKPATEASKT